VIDTDAWLAACRAATTRIVRSMQEAVMEGSVAELVGTVGAGGDATLAVDAVAEAHIFDELTGLQRRGSRFTVVSEERGTVEFGASDGHLVVAVDPIDGSLNAKRMLVHHAVSIAIAEGASVDDVVLGYVFDLGTKEEYVGIAGRGAWIDGKPIPARQTENRLPDGRLELLAVEAHDARALAAPFELVGEIASKVRVLGSIAAGVCQLAVGRVDAMINTTRCRPIDCAGAWIIAREAGVLWDFPDDASPLLDLQHRSRFAAARTDATLAQLIDLMEPHRTDQA
jgi:myo-inositol-1(or 4)-monophosphatase